jgi:hypothetical protein
VKTVKYKFDDETWDQARTAFSSACVGTTTSPYPTSQPVTISLAGLGSGDHSLLARAYDASDRFRDGTYTVHLYPTSVMYGGGDGGVGRVVDTVDERVSLISALGSASAQGRVNLWSGLSPADQNSFVSALVPTASQNRDDDGFASDSQTVSALLRDPDALAYLEDYGAPFTADEFAAFSPTDSPSGPEDDTDDTETVEAAARAMSRPS